MEPSNLARLPDLSAPPQRVVSLVPSLTESLFDLGFGESLVGITEYCCHPADKVAGLPRLGGTKNARLDEIVALEPDLVFVNQEENSPELVGKLLQTGLKVWMSHPQTVDQALTVLRGLMAIYHSDDPEPLVHNLQMSVDWARAASENRAPIRYFCPIWQGVYQGRDWWMTFNQRTYPHDLLSLFGGENIFAQRERRHPLSADLGMGEPQETSGRDHRYPRVTAEEVINAAPELILLPTEPYAYTQTHLGDFYRRFAATPAARDQRIVVLDGSLVTWHGTRIAQALQALPPVFA